MTMIKKGLLAAGLLFGATGLAAAAPAMVAGDLNLRAGPGTGYGVLTTMPAGATVRLIGCSGSWCRVSYRGFAGYASASYLAPARGYRSYGYSRPAMGAGPRWRHHGWHGGPRYYGHRPYRGW